MLRTGLEFLLFFAFAALLQWREGAMSAEFGGYADESAHLVTGLMVRDYLATFPLQPPLPFAENYYLHYPKVAFGHWPPLFYIAQAAWMLALPVSRASVLLFMAAWMALLATILRRTLRAETSPFSSWCAALILVALPLIAEYTGMIMAEIQVAALMFAAAIFFGRYLDSGNRGQIVWFGIFTCLAILTKGNAWALALMPIGAAFISKQSSRLRSLWFWMPGLVAAAICIPWFYLTMPMARLGWGPEPGWSDRWLALSTNAFHLLTAGGWVVTACAALGIWDRIVRPSLQRKKIGGIWAACFALVLAILVFHSFFFCTTETRHLISSIPPWIMFQGAGLYFVARLGNPGRWISNRREAALTAVAATMFFVTTFRIIPKPNYHFGPAVATILGRPETRNAAVLVSIFGEGPFVAEIALHERRPGHVILRAGKVLAHASWSGLNYQVQFATSKELLDYLDRVPVGVVVVDPTLNSGTPEHQRLLLKALAEQPREWEPMHSDGDAGAVVLFRRKGLETLTGTINLNAADMLPFSPAQR